MAEDALATGSDPLVRLGALHHLHRRIDRDQLGPRLSQILHEFKVSELQNEEPDVSIFPLHVAIALAQEGGADGITWLLQFLAGSGPKHERLGFTALRNCRQFPLAVVLGSAVTAAGLESSHSFLGNLTTFSEEDARYLEEKGNAVERAEFVARVDAAIEKISNEIRKDRHLARGVVITRPLRRESGFRYSGFLLVEESSTSVRGIPYRMSSLINRDDGSSTMSALDLVSDPGREVIVVYETVGDCEAQVVYAVPFTDPMPVNPLMARAASSCKGLTIGVVVHKMDTGSVTRYRYVTASGRTDIVNRHHAAQPLELGNCWLLHESSPLAVFSRINLSQAEARQIIFQFQQRTNLEKTVLLQAWEKGFKLGGQTGRLETFRGEPPQDLVVLLEDKIVNEEERTFPVSLPLARWTSEDRTSVLQDFFTSRLASYAVVVDLLKTHRGGFDALIVHPDSKRYEFRPATADVTRGTPVFWEDSEGRTFTTFLRDCAVNPQCGFCFDSGASICQACEGTGRVTCPQCGGSGKSTCGHCDGSGERRLDCRGCRGTGSCGNCGGSATVTLNCKICDGTGRYSDSGRPCKKCGGDGTFEVDCRVCTRGPQPHGQCPNCEGSGDFVQPCRSCNQTGLWNCEKCRTTGVARCENCGGSLVSDCRCGGSKTVRIIAL